MAVPLELDGLDHSHLLKLLLDMERIAVARGFWHHCFLASPQSTANIGNRVVWVTALCHHIQQMPTPSILITMFYPLKEVAVSGRGIDTH